MGKQVNNDFIEITASLMSINKRKLVHGVGVNDAWYMIESRNENGRKRCPFYKTWNNMLKRCYSGSDSTYKECIVYQDWLIFSNFKNWMENQDWQGKELDKDIIKYGDKIYSPENCCFVDSSVNLLLIDSNAIRGKYPQGVHFDKFRNKFKAQISKFNKNIFLGRYNTPEQAFQVYKQAKYNHILHLVNGLGDPRVIEGLKIHAEKLLNDVEQVLKWQQQ